MSKWVGFAVSVNCGEPLGCYQGTILEADGSTITLTKAFRNGFPYPKSQVTLNAADIKDLKIIESRPDPPEQTHSTVAIAKGGKKAQRATVCENLQANPSNSSSGASLPVASGSGVSSNTKLTPACSKPIDIQGSRGHKTNSHTGGGSTPKARFAGGGERERRRNEDCFGEAAEGACGDDYDFEGNLALFDKRAEWARLRQRHAQRPDLVRHADDSYRHDENVIEGAAAACPRPRCALRVPDHLRGPFDYVTDEGVAVASVAPQLRRRLRERMVALGLADTADALLARAAADVALRLVGGDRRLDPRNAHQAPTVVALVGPHRAGAAGLLTARLLASHGARAAVLVSGGAAGGEGCEGPLRRELAALALSGVRPAAGAGALPSADVVLLALYEPALDDAQEAHAAALAWAAGARAAVLALEPPARGWEGVRARAAVVGVAPCALPPALGRVLLADVAPPLGLFAELRLEYRPPFGATPLLALHPVDADADADD
ncbi:hypothetical protein K1T71_010540 [Dendrolimus kikuchii]|uniref:Uncharacterized protein n=1 Tax=Dendrolimus kikuchii TaxID=765133 RepID=A0ACC1CRV2_9NEOP|nr:hypothetical protein K1T71_010540 [Dendrolimus kikuchii]